MVETKTKETSLTDAEKVAEAEANHMWLNAFSCISPSDEFCLDVGRAVVRALNESMIVGDFMGVEIGKVTYIRLNKS